MTAVEATPTLTIADHADRAFLGHPKGLAYLAFAEAWERFSYYGMQTLLVLYMVKHLLLPGNIEHIALIDAFRSLPFYRGLEGQPLASAIFGTYAASVYLTPILGGLLADKLLGKRRTVLIGAVVMAIGHFLMAFETSFLFALLCIVVGCGCFKGNIASQVGSLYKPDDLRRADAFQLFYMGISAGAILSPFIVGTLGEEIGWHYGFGAAGVGMLIGLTIYLAGQKYLPPEILETKAEQAAPAAPMTRSDYLALGAILSLIPVMAVSFVPNNQIFNAYLTWGDEKFDLVFFGMRLPTSFLVGFDAFVSLAFLAIVALFYRWYGKRWSEPDEITKMIIGSAFSVLATLCLFMAASTEGSDGKIGLFWPIMFHIVNSIAFAQLLPVSLALFARLAPKSLNATVIGLYYLSLFGANAMVGKVGGFYSTMATPAFWLMHTGFAVAAGTVFLLFKLLLAKRLMGSPAPQVALA